MGNSRLPEITVFLPLQRHSAATATDYRTVGDTRARAPTPGRRVRIQYGPGVVVWSRVLRVRILEEHDDLGGIGGPVAQRMQLKRALERRGRDRGLHSGERIAVPYAPPALHFDLL